MQLDQRPSLRRALAAASCGLLGISSASADTSDNLQTDNALLYYAEKDRVKVAEYSGIFTQNLGDDETVSLSPTIDSITGASPTGATISDKAQSIGSNDTTPANTLPVKHFIDHRFAASLSWQRPLDRLTKTVLGAEGSAEHDYTSLGLNGSIARDFDNKLTTLSASMSADFDTVLPAGGIVPQGLTPLASSTSTVAASSSSVNPVFTESSSGAVTHSVTSVSGLISGGGGSYISNGGNSYYAPHESRGKQVIDGNIGLTRVINRRTLMQFNYGLGISNGYLTDPYKIISMIDGTSGETTGYITEQRPQRRLRQTLYWETVVHLPQDIVHLSYRYFWDDWGIRSHTVDMHYDFELGHGFYIEPQARYYTQTAADFYHHSLVDGAPLPDFASADYRLAQMTSLTYGVKLAIPVGDNGELSARASYMKQTGVSHPDDAIGVQRALDLYPGLEAIMIQLGLTLQF